MFVALEKTSNRSRKVLLSASQHPSKVSGRPKSEPTQTGLEEEYFYNVDEKTGYILYILRLLQLFFEIGLGVTTFFGDL